MNTTTASSPALPRWLKDNPAAAWAWQHEDEWRADAIASSKDAKWRKFLLREAERMYQKSVGRTLPKS